MKKHKLGPTGDYPCGKMSDDDEGALEVGMRIVDGVFQLHFGGRVSWIGLHKEQAKILVERLLVYIGEVQ